MSVMITGASGGLGRAFALECAERGYDILLTDIDGQKLDKVKSGIERQYDVGVYAIPCDITNDSATDSLIAAAKNANIKLDMLINVAGIDHEGAFTEQRFDHIAEILRVNIEGTLRITYKTLAIRRSAGKFHIVFVSSLASMYPMPLKATYAASKRFLLDFSLALGQELKHENVSVLALCPGGMPTTANCINAIEAQGFWGGATTNALERVVHRTISRSLCGRKIYFPGAINRTFSLAANIIPSSIIAKLLYKRWNRAQGKWRDIAEKDLASRRI